MTLKPFPQDSHQAPTSSPKPSSSRVGFGKVGQALVPQDFSPLGRMRVWGLEPRALGKERVNGWRSWISQGEVMAKSESGEDLLVSPPPSPGPGVD